MDYISPLYLFVFLPGLLFLYTLIPKKYRWFLLLLASYCFYFLISRQLIIFLLAATGAAYAGGLLIGVQEARSGAAQAAHPEQAAAIRTRALRTKRLILFASIAVPAGLLLFLKYYNFFGSNVNLLLSHSPSGPLPALRLALPLGISFYTLQAVSYLVDVSQGKIQPDRHPGRFALYMSFFPIIMEGPICRYSQIAPALYAGQPLKGKNISFGAQRILWGLFKKLVIADRLNPMVNAIFNHHELYGGMVVVLGAVCYAFQLYADFSGCIDITIGAGEMFGVAIPENFRQPFFARTASEFWRRWHMTLGAWLKDYIFFPVSLSRLGKKLTKKARRRFGRRAGQIAQTVLPLAAVWLCSGLWHGAGWNYIFYGLYYFVLILLETILQPLCEKAAARLSLDMHGPLIRTLQTVKMLLVIFTGELFFRANGLRAGFAMLGSVFSGFSWSVFTDGTFLQFGLVPGDFAVAGVALLIVLLVDILHERGVHIREQVSGWKRPLRWCFYYAAILAVIFFGAYGTGYLPADMIYAGF